MKKIIISKTQLFNLNEENVNIGAQAQNNTTSDFINAATNPNIISDINKARVAGDVNLVVNGPKSDDTQPQQMVNVAPGETIQNAINNQTNDELIRNGGSIKISGDGFGEAKTFSKKTIEEIRLANMRKTGTIMTKKQLIESLKLI